MYNEEGQVLTITGKNLEECKKQLFDAYGRDWQIVNKGVDYKYTGFLHLKKEAFTKVDYIVKHRESYSSNSSFENDDSNEQGILNKNRDAIIQNNQNLILAKTIKDLQEQVLSMHQDLNKNISTSDKHETISKIEELLQQNEFTFSYIQMIDDKIRQAFSLDELEDFDLVEKKVVDWIGESINIAKERVVRPPHVIIIVGPTGVGKTTTLAKMAAMKVLDANKNNRPRPELCLITIDTMRVGALEQLSKFGDILGKKVLKAETSDDVKSIYMENKDHVDYLFIDTSGYSPNDSSHIGEMKKILSVDNLNPDVYLSVCATTKASDLNNIFRNYEPFGYDSVIVTKQDETNQMGNIISVLFEKHKSVAYITDGQHVPRNIKKATVIDFLLTLKGFNIDREHIEEKFGDKK